jgi:hypothetical protein
MSAIDIILSAAGIVLKLVAIGLLAGYLVFTRRERLRKRTPIEDAAKWTGKPIDATKPRPAVERVRSDYIAAQARVSQSLPYRRSLLAMAGRAIRRLPFFRERQCEDGNLVLPH